MGQRCEFSIKRVVGRVVSQYSIRFSAVRTWTVKDGTGGDGTGGEFSRFAVRGLSSSPEDPGFI